MKLLLHFKTIVLLAYVALCTHLVLTVLEVEPGSAAVTLPQSLDD